MMKIKIKFKKRNAYEIYVMIAMFLYFLFSYNVSLRDYIYPHTAVIFLSLLLAVACMFLADSGSMAILSTPSLVWLVAFMFMIVYRNADIGHGDYAEIFYFLIALSMFFLLQVTDGWHTSAFRVMEAFTLVHIAATWILYFLPDLYYNQVIPLFDGSSQEVLRGSFYNGYGAGITNHQSTNGIYLSIGLLLFFCRLYDPEIQAKKTKRNRQVLLILVTLVTLLITGKRGVLMFSIAAIVMVLLLEKYKSRKKKNIILLGAVCIVVFVVLLSSLFPAVAAPLIRFFDGVAAGDVTTGRDRLYDLAMDLFRKNPIFGVGWGGYKYHFENSYLGNTNMYGYSRLGAHNVFLQILCETGIVGFVLFMFLFMFPLFKTISLFRAYSKQGNLGMPQAQKHTYILAVSLAVQVYFILYCLSGNPLYDVPVLFPYILMSAVPYSYVVAKSEKRVTSLQKEVHA